MSVHLLFILACVLGAAAYFLHNFEKNRYYREKEERLEDIMNYKDNSYNERFEQKTLDGWKSEYFHREREKEKNREYRILKSAEYIDDWHNRYPALMKILVWGAWCSFVMFLAKFFSPFFE